PGALARARSVPEVQAQFDGVANSGKAIVQEFIKGTTISTPVLFRHGVPVCWFSYAMEHPWPTPFAAASSARITDHPDLAGALRVVGETSAFHGLAGIDWLLETDSRRLLFLELNARPIPGTFLGKRAGVDFSAALRDMAANRPA